MRPLLKSLLPLAAVLCSASAALADDLKTVAVVVEPRASARAQEAQQVYDAMQAALVGDKVLTVVERDQLDKALKELKLGQSGMTGDQVQLQLGKLVSAQVLFLSAVAWDDSGLTVSGKALQVETGAVLGTGQVKVKSPDSLPKVSRVLARMLQDAVTHGHTLADSGETAKETDWELKRVSEGGRQLAGYLAQRFPKVKGKLREVLPNNTTSCVLSDPRAAFANQRFKVVAVNDITGQLEEKGLFLLTAVNEKGACSGRLKSDGPEPIVDGDTIESIPLSVAFDALQVGDGFDPDLGLAFSKETAASVKNQGAFDTESDKPQVRIGGRISGVTSQAKIEVQALESKGAVLEKWSFTGNFAAPKTPVRPPR
jgi:Curli production assembly/transport component CsgG